MEAAKNQALICRIGSWKFERGWWIVLLGLLSKLKSMGLICFFVAFFFALYCYLINV